MSRRAIFSLVRVETLATSEAVQYATQAADHDEVVLADIYGEPCANPTIAQEEDRGIFHEYADGSEGKTPIVTAKTVSVAVDFLGADLYQRLARWKAEDAEVLLAPGYGRRTEFAWRPLVTSASTFSDLTGKYTLTIAGDATRDNTWDAPLRVMRDGFTGKQRILRTPAGAGQVFEEATENQFAIDNPESGSLGWTAGGAGSASLTVAYKANGFGHADCAHSCLVTATSSTSARSISSAVLPSGVAGLGTLNVGQWVRGRFPAGATLGCYNAPGGLALAGEYGDWTYVTTQFLDTFVESEPYIYIDLTTASSAGSFEFELGPRTAVFTAASGGTADGQYSMPSPQWQATGAARTADTLTTTANMAWPQNGTLFASFFVPSDYAASWTSQLIGIVGASAGWTYDLFFAAYPTSSRLRLAFYYSNTGPKSVAGYADGSALTPGAVNTACGTINGNTASLYINGVLIASSSVSTNAARDFSASALRIGDRPSGPFLLNTVRLEREPWSADRVLQEHVTATDPRALGVVVGCRGRRFKIVALPTVQRQTAGAAYWSGNIVLKQVGYTSALADIVTQEVL